MEKKWKTNEIFDSISYLYGAEKTFENKENDQQRNEEGNKVMY